MSNFVLTQVAGAMSSYRYTQESYDPDKLGLGPMMIQQNGGGDESFVGPIPIAVVRPMEAATAIPVGFPWAMRWSNSVTSQIDWIFCAEILTAATAIRRLTFATMNRLTGVMSHVGFVTVTFPGTPEAKTIRWLRGAYSTHTTGTVTVSGTAVTGTGTAFQSDGACVGNRIGFGSTDPEQITQWYEISAIASETGITLTTTAGTIAGGTAYVIEDLRLLVGVTSVTTSLGGVYMVEGLRVEQFTSIGGTIPAAVSTDKIRQCIFLKDATTGTALATFGAGLEPQANKSTHFLWQLHTLTNPIMQKYNIRAALTISGGSTTSALVLITGSGGALTGSASQLNNGRYALVQHGPGAGVGCIYFTTVSRVYRTANVNSITTASTSWLIDSMLETPPGTTNTFNITGGMQAIEYMDTIDRFVITTVSSQSTRSYLTRYLTDGSQFDRIIFVDARQSDQSLADATTTPFPSINSTIFTIGLEGGMAYIERFINTAFANQLYAVPLGADWDFASTTNCRVIFPRMNLNNAGDFTRAFMNTTQVIGGASGKNLGMPCEPVRLYYRTAGITDDSGSWTLLPENGLMNGVTGVTSIQFMAEFRIGNTTIPGRIHAIGAAYNATGVLPSANWQESVGQSSVVNAQFAWRFKTAYGTTIPRLRIRLYNAVTGALLDDDDSVTQAGTWEKSTNGGVSYGSWNSTDKTNETTYLRWTPAATSSVNVRPLLTEY
jgi:hypothetical protein